MRLAMEMGTAGPSASTLPATAVAPPTIAALQSCCSRFTNSRCSTTRRCSCFTNCRCGTIRRLLDTGLRKTTVLFYSPLCIN